LATVDCVYSVKIYTKKIYKLTTPINTMCYKSQGTPPNVINSQLHVHRK